MTDANQQKRGPDLSRRQLLHATSMGLGATAAGARLPGVAPAARAGSGLPKAKRVIFLFMPCAPSQLDLFDYKPGLADLHGEPLPKSVSQGQRVTAMTRGSEKLVVASMFGFRPAGESGVEWSELLPHLARQADHICLVESLRTNAINHDPGKTFLCTGSKIAGRASMGSWLSYGLGTMNWDLPDFVVLNSAFWTGGTRNVQGLYSRLWGNGYLPSKHQGVAFQTAGGPVHFSPIQGAWTRPCAGACSTPCARSTRPTSRSRATRRSAPPSPRPRWPSACRARFPS